MSLLTFPTARVITARSLTPDERACEIENLATCVRGLSRYSTEVLLTAYSRDTLRGAALWNAWEQAAGAVAARDATDRADPAYPRRAASAAAAVRFLFTTDDTTTSTQKAGA